VDEKDEEEKARRITRSTNLDEVYATVQKSCEEAIRHG
jgi:hypothetical protein